MSHSRSMILMLCVSFVLLVINANSQQAASVGPGQQSTQNSQTEITLNGTVHDVALLPAENGTCTHVKLNSGGHVVEVSLGPTRLLDTNQFTVSKGDYLQVAGSKVKTDSGDVFVARDVMSGNKHLTPLGTSLAASPSGYMRGGCLGGNCANDGCCNKGDCRDGNCGGYHHHGHGCSGHDGGHE